MRNHVSKMARKRAQQKSRIGNDMKLAELGEVVLQFLPATSKNAMRLDEIELQLKLRHHHNVPVGQVLERLCREYKAVGARVIYRTGKWLMFGIRAADGAGLLKRRLARPPFLRPWGCYGVKSSYIRFIETYALEDLQA